MRPRIGRAAVRDIADRVYADFLMPSRLNAYASLLELALGSGYEVHSVGSFWRLAPSPCDAQPADPPGPGSPPSRPPGRILVLRHDVDTDPATARAMWRIDRHLGVRSSYFFRLGTLDVDLAEQIAAGEGEVGYHYEELASVIKRRRIRTRAAALAVLPMTRGIFAANLERMREQTGLAMRVAASHGDFVNRRVGVANWEILADPTFRAQVGIDLETYDASLLACLPHRFTDSLHPRYWEPADPASAIRAAEPVVSLLVHPRHWRPDRAGNLRDDLRRLVEEARYRLPG